MPRSKEGFSQKDWESRTRKALWDFAVFPLIIFVGIAILGGFMETQFEVSEAPVRVFKMLGGIIFIPAWYVHITKSEYGFDIPGNVLRFIKNFG